MNVDVVIGANLGDEGKGTVVAQLTKNTNGNVLNILTNGGSQRAHSILTENGSFTFQHFGSGTYHGADTYFSEFFILNPIQFVKEYDELLNRGINLNGRVYRHFYCRWSTPYDMMANQIIESLRGASKHGSCGIGIWETVKRYQYTFTLPFDEFMSLPHIEKIDYLSGIKKYFEKEIGDIPLLWKSVWNDAFLMEHFVHDCQKMQKYTRYDLNKKDYDRIIFENGQGLMLCDTGKDIAGTTPSLTNSKYALDIAKNFEINEKDIILHYVTRPYLTRHGKGFLENESNRNYIASTIDQDRTNHYNIHQDDFRYASLNINELQKRIKTDNIKNFKSIIELTHCDEMDRESDFKKAFKVVNTYDTPLI